ncbi:hypothetical protein [Thiohalomonas denitrificans]|uniref:Uncharacterized protein n=1 Tax=Thiohalomonas denitrificans TaxID=415747 RepID=A0A1G5QA32_9GAMM|nr:hypothetical protein [Thiohalomonas denitrificans]SCZ58360.1 hypothetical protein SAMN03097708_01673 [Thiohalomonas denitrificans]
MSDSVFTIDQPGLFLINNDPPGVRCNRNVQAAAEIANSYRVPICAVPRSALETETAAPAVYFAGELVTVDGDAHNGVADYALLAEVMERAGVPKQERPGRLAEIGPDLEAFRASIGEVPS